VQDKIIMLSRDWQDHTTHKRIIDNQKELADALREKYGAKFELFRPGRASTEMVIRLLERAEVVLGSHGGALYNALWASRECKVVEISPLLLNGAYPDHLRADRPLVFAHLAFHTVAMMNFQSFYRYYHHTQAMNYVLDIPTFLHWFNTTVYH
jgi:capsular polysaccharide biosynthesis protein